MDDGPVRRMDDPANQAFIDAITAGSVCAKVLAGGPMACTKPSTCQLCFVVCRRVPKELGTGDKSIEMVDKRAEEYVPPPPPAYIAFSGGGRSLR